MICRIANSLWLASSLPELARFHRAIDDVRGTQEGVLNRLLRANLATEFGRGHNFTAIRSVRDYQERIPLREYEDFRPWIDRIAAGARAILTSEPVRLLEPTSGSTGGTKLIPYTRSLQHDFNRGIRAWVADLFRNRPALLSGPAYWSVSPAGPRHTRTPGGISIGFDDDSAYVARWQRPFVRAVMAVPPEIRLLRDMDRFRYETLLALVRTPALRLISVWNPTFLSLLVRSLPECRDALVRDVARHDPQRATVVREALDAAGPAERHAMLWPDLRVISCWTDANAENPAAEIRRLFPQTEVHGKGLVATEAFVSFPLLGREGAALSVRSHFFEFAPVDSGDVIDRERLQLAHELDPGARYAVVTSTGSGLYRYLLNDVVEVVGHLGRCPMIRFVGRHRHVSDWFGEKLNERFVRSAVQHAFEKEELSPSFAMLACDRSLTSPAYVLYADADGPDAALIRAGGRIERQLRRSFHYDYARRLGQLAPLRVFRAEDGAAAYLLSEAGDGRRAGDVKPPALDRRDGWSQRLRGRFLPDEGHAAPVGAS